MKLGKLIITLSILVIPSQVNAYDFSKMKEFEKRSLYVEIMRVYSASKTLQPLITYCEKKTEKGAKVRRKYSEFVVRHSKHIKLGELITNNPEQHEWLYEKMKKMLQI